jgi:predicted TIM-barrel fold metal-dependent hydrolase
MTRRWLRYVLAFCATVAATCAPPPSREATAPAEAPAADPALVTFIANIRAVDNHSHPNSTAPGDPDADALPLDGLGAFEMPAPLRPEHPNWIAAYRALYRYPYADLSDAHKTELHATLQKTAKQQGDAFPTWVLDQVGTEVLLANRIAMGPGLAPPRVRWVSYADALMLPLSSKAEAAVSPDRAKLYPLEDALLRRYLSDLKIDRLPATLDAYLTKVVTPTLEAQRAGGCVAVKFEAAYLRTLGFDDAFPDVAGRIYGKYAVGGVPSRAEYKTLQDFLFRFIAREAGRLGMAVHIHSFEGAGNFFDAAGADPLLLEPVFDDPSLRATDFVIIHGGGAFAAHTGALLWKPNVYADMSLMGLAYPPSRLARVLEDWIAQYPERVLFGSDANAMGPEMGWELTAWVGSKNARTALALALTDLIRKEAITRARAEQIATMVMRTNASKLYHLDLK